ncbi:hypothetical protein ABKN59_010326 [Abortiporus biennis]
MLVGISILSRNPSPTKGFPVLENQKLKQLFLRNQSFFKPSHSIRQAQPRIALFSYLAVPGCSPLTLFGRSKGLDNKLESFYVVIHTLDSGTLRKPVNFHMYLRPDIRRISRQLSQLALVVYRGPVDFQRDLLDGCFATSSTIYDGVLTSRIVDSRPSPWKCSTSKIGRGRMTDSAKQAQVDVNL